MNRRFTVLIGALLVASAVSGCAASPGAKSGAAGPVAQSRPQTGSVVPATPGSQTAGPAPAGRWLKAGPYEVRLDKATVSAKASVPDLREPRQYDGVPHLKPHERLVVVWISIRNPGTALDATLAAPATLDAITLADARGSKIPACGVGLSRSGPVPASSPGANGPGPMSHTPLGPQEILMLDAEFVVPSSSTSLTVVDSVLGKASPYVARFIVR